MRNVAVFLFRQVLLWCVLPIFPVAPVGDFVETHAVWVSPRSRQEVTTKRGRAKTPTMLPKGWTEYETGAPCRITRPSPRPLAGPEVVGTPGDANDVSRPGSDRWRCRWWVGS